MTTTQPQQPEQPIPAGTLPSPGSDMPMPGARDLRAQAGPMTVVGLQAPPRGLSITALVLGICGLPLCFFPLVSVVGLILGLLGLRKEPAGRSMALAGTITSAIVVGLWVVFALYILFTAIGVSLAAATNANDGL